MKARKSKATKGTKPALGQHFLHSGKVLSDILDAAEVTPGEIVLEIGPGKGFLTRGLLEKGATVFAIEKDKNLVVELKTMFSREISEKKLIIIESDIRDFETSKLKALGNNYKLIANIPYYITGEIIRQFLEEKNQPKMMMLMLQKEVAMRIVARDGKESLLSFGVKAYGRPKIIRLVGRGSFTPAPKIDSAVLKIDKISRDFFKTIKEKSFFDLLHTSFAHKRKKLAGNLSNKYSAKNINGSFLKSGLNINARAEDFSLENFKDLAKNLK